MNERRGQTIVDYDVLILLCLMSIVSKIPSSLQNQSNINQIECLSDKTDSTINWNQTVISNIGQIVKNRTKYIAQDVSTLNSLLNSIANSIYNQN